MTVRLRWYDTDRVIYAEFIGKMTKTFIEVGNGHFLQALERSQAEKVYFVVDVSGVSYISSISLFRGLDFLKHPRCAQSAATVGAKNWLRAIAGPATLLMFREKMFFADTVDEAVKVLAKNIPDLHDLTPHDLASLPIIVEDETVG